MVTAGRPESDARAESRVLQLAAEASSVRVARHAASDFAAGWGLDQEAVALAVSEAVTNAVVHAYRDSYRGEIVLAMQPNGEGILITVSDAGAGILPDPSSPGLGFGLALVASLTDEVAITESPQGGTALRMRFRPTD